MSVLLGASLVVVRAGVCKISFLSDSTLQVHGGQWKEGLKLPSFLGCDLQTSVLSMVHSLLGLTLFDLTVRGIVPKTSS